jgi:hypothetical protein
MEMYRVTTLAKTSPQNPSLLIKLTSLTEFGISSSGGFPKNQQM